MQNNTWVYVVVILVSVFISAVSQLLLKKAAMRSYSNIVKEYLNPLVIIAYGLFFLPLSSPLLPIAAFPFPWGPF